MKKLTILLITLIVSLSSYSQNISKPNYKDSIIKKEIAYYLTEGLECKELLVQKNNQLKLKDSIITTYIQISKIQVVKDSLTKKQYESLLSDYEVCNTEYNKLGHKIIKVNNTNKILFGTSSGLLLALLILLL